MHERRIMELKQAQDLAKEIVDQLAPYCSQIEVAGSIRRRRPFPRDIDIVLIPKNQGQLAVALQGLGQPRRAGTKIEERFYKGAQVDFYFATPETWATLLLIRTGPKAHNIRLATMAKNKGWHLHADGKGLVDENGKKVSGDTERSFFDALGIPYAEPWERDR